LIGRVGQPIVGREDLGKTVVDVGNFATQQCLNLRDMSFARP